MISLKIGVGLRGLVPQMVLATLVVDQVYTKRGVEECVITSANDGVHGVNSLHSRDGLCRACDYRTNIIPRELVEPVVAEIKWRLGLNYDVVIENLGEPNEHLHVEYDPKGVA